MRYGDRPRARCDGAGSSARADGSRRRRGKHGPLRVVRLCARGNRHAALALLAPGLGLRCGSDAWERPASARRIVGQHWRQGATPALRGCACHPGHRRAAVVVIGGARAQRGDDGGARRAAERGGHRHSGRALPRAGRTDVRRVRWAARSGGHRCGGRRRRVADTHRTLSEASRAPAGPLPRRCRDFVASNTAGGGKTTIGGGGGGTRAQLHRRALRAAGAAAQCAAARAARCTARVTLGGRRAGADLPPASRTLAASAGSGSEA
mmetsp:Transcript_16674/g.51813  ORF Transcript_16674/g.51813 Transcript_16674/m.51813 type:complete len:265 (+) Transcript_16674:1966-2760(+)